MIESVLDAMGFIPDEAIYSGGEVSQSAFRVYACLCAHRNHRTGTSRPDRSLLQAEAGVGASYVSTLKSELLSKGWIEIIEGDEVRLLKGDFSPVGRSKSKARTVENDISAVMNDSEKQNGTYVNDSEKRKGHSEKQNRTAVNHSEKQNPPYIEPEQLREPDHLTRTQSAERVGASTERLMDLYREVVHPTASLHPNTVRSWEVLIQVRLQEGWAEAKLAAAINGCGLDDWEDRWKFNGIDHILKDRNSIERFIKIAANAKKQTNGNQNGQTAQPEHNAKLGPRMATIQNRDYSIFSRRGGG